MSENQIFLNRIKHYIDSIEKTPNKTVREKLETLAFCILVMVDGEDIETGPYSMRPIDEEGNEGEDIAGNLHNEFYNHRSLC
jgi:hypothetical protein